MRLVLIGFIVSGFLSMALVCSAAELTWAQKADMPTPRWKFASCDVDGKIYAIGGRSSEPGDVALSTVEEYDPATDTWTRKADMLRPRSDLSTSAVSGRIYAIGGNGIGASVVEEYDLATDTWTRKADMPTPRRWLATCALNGKIYAIGGTSLGVYEGLKTVEEYDPVTDTWTRKADMPFRAWGLSTSVVDGKIYAIGGASSISANHYVQEYDPTTETWTRKANMTYRARGHSTSVLGGRIYAVGGWQSSGRTPYSIVEVYDPATNTWTKIADIPEVRACLSTSVVNDRIYVIGGTDRPHPCPATSTVYESGPLLDFNDDGIVDSDDTRIMLDHWHKDESLCDVGPMPLGDGIVDAQDLIVLAEYLLFEDVSLVAHWKLEETEGIIAHNSINGNDGTLNGNPAWLPAGGMIGGALQFDGIDDYISTPFILDPAKGSLSAFAWIYGGVPGQVILSQTGDFGGTWLGVNPSDGTLMTGFSDMYFGTLQSESVITDGQWHHVGLVYDWDSLHRRLYVDGVQVAEDATVVSSVPSDGGLYIGASKDLDATSFFSGFIDDVRIYDAALTAEEIAALAQ